VRQRFRDSPYVISSRCKKEESLWRPPSLSKNTELVVPFPIFQPSRRKPENMAQDSEKRFDSIMDKLFHAPKSLPPNSSRLVPFLFSSFFFLSVCDFLPEKI
jgi:hypothetical protein